MSDETKKLCRIKWNESVIGMRFGRLVVTSLAGRSKRGVMRVWAKCDCGNEKVYQSNGLPRGVVVSCGCFNKDASKSRFTTHGQHNSPTYKTWQMLIQRCTNKSCESFCNYGGRGIRVCNSWRTSFTRFVADMGKRQAGYSIERINNDGDYCPSNCMWASAGEQRRNTRRTRLITYNGITLCMTDWAARIGVPMTTLRGRLNHGWTLMKALTPMETT